MTKTKKSLPKNLKIRIALVAGLFAVIIIYSVATLIYRAGKTKVSIQIAPNDATITINDTRVGNKSDCWLIPGKYHLVATSNEHLAVYERDFEVKNEPLKIYATLSALDDEGKNYIEKHRQEYAVVEGLIGEQLNKEGEKERENNPIISHLPINNSLYSISYEYNENNQPIINIKSELKYLDIAVEKLKTFKDVNISSLNLVFHNKNTFEQFHDNNNSDIIDFIKTAYSLPNNYKINEIKQINNYYYTSIYIDDYNNNLQYAHYRILLKQKGESWEVISAPQPILTTFNTLGVAKDILDIINSY